MSYVTTDEILVLDNLDDVIEKVKTAKSEWKPLGRKLLTAALRYELTSIESEHRSDDERLYAMLEVWLKNKLTLKPSWGSLKEALVHIGREDLADNIDGTLGECLIYYTQSVFSRYTWYLLPIQ